MHIQTPPSNSNYTYNKRPRRHLNAFPRLGFPHVQVLHKILHAHETEGPLVTVKFQPHSNDPAKVLNYVY